MPGLQDIPGNHTARGYVPGQSTAGTANVWALFVAPDTIEITGVRWVPHAAVSGANTNNFSLAVQNRGATDSTGTTAVTTTKTYASGTNSVANDPEAFTLSATAANLDAVAGDVIALVRTITGDGLASPAGFVEIDYRFA